MRITVPLLAPTIGLTLIVNTITASKVFTELFPLFNGNPGSAYSLYTVVYYLYDMFYTKWELGPAGGKRRCAVCHCACADGAAAVCAAQMEELLR